MVLCLAGTFAALEVHRSNSTLADGFDDVLFQRPTAATIELLEDADSPLNPDALRERSLAIALVKTGRPAGGERIALRMVREEPESVENWVVLSRLQRTLGKDAAARRSFARARELNSQIPALGLPPRL